MTLRSAEAPRLVTANDLVAMRTLLLVMDWVAAGTSLGRNGDKDVGTGMDVHTCEEKEKARLSTSIKGLTS